MQCKLHLPKFFHGVTGLQGLAWLRKSRVGIVLILSGLIFLVFPPVPFVGGGKMAIGGFLASGCWILGAALLSGHVLVRLAGLIKPYCAGPITRLVFSRLQDGSSRHYSRLPV